MVCAVTSTYSTTSTPRCSSAWAAVRPPWSIPCLEATTFRERADQAPNRSITAPATAMDAIDAPSHDGGLTGKLVRIPVHRSLHPAIDPGLMSWYVTKP